MNVHEFKTCDSTVRHQKTIDENNERLAFKNVS